MRFLAKVTVTLKKSILDPQGDAVRAALESMGYDVDQVRLGKSIELRLSADDLEACTQVVDKICSSLLANPVMETYKFEIVEESAK